MAKNKAKTLKRSDMRQEETFQHSIVQTVRYLSKYMHGYWKDTIITWCAVLVESICEVLVVYFMQDLINSVQNLGGTTTMNSVYLYAGIMAACALVAVGAGILAGIFAASASAGFGKNLREAMFIHIQDYSFRNIDKFSTSSIVTRTTTDVTNVQNAVLMIIRAVVRAPFLMIISLIMCFITDWKLAWIFLIIIPIVLFALLGLAKVVHPYFVKVFNTYDDLNESVEENVDGIRVVKSFNREDDQIRHFKGVSDLIYRCFFHAESIINFNSPVMQGAVYTAELLIAYFASYQIVGHHPVSYDGSAMNVGKLSTLITYVMLIMMSLMLISMVYTMIIIGRNSSERIVEILEEKPEIVSPANPIREVPNGEVDFEDVSYAYVQGKPVLNHINVKVPSGATIGILGSTGSSKTTLVSLIARLYDVTEGKVLVGGHDVREYDLKVLRDAVAVVLQKNTLFTGTIRDNLKWGNANATDEEIMKACDVAQVTPFLKDMPNGLDTQISQGGTNVSGGQKQRLCIARALLKNPKILILDDSTSACDTHTDALIRQGLQHERTDVTKFIIAQRVLSVKDCDEIWVMNEGKIVNRGNSETLLETSQVYRELYESQLGGGDFDASK